MSAPGESVHLASLCPSRHRIASAPVVEPDLYCGHCLESLRGYQSARGRIFCIPRRLDIAHSICWSFLWAAVSRKPCDLLSARLVATQGSIGLRPIPIALVIVEGRWSDEALGLFPPGTHRPGAECLHVSCGYRTSPGFGCWCCTPHPEDR